MNRDDDHDLVAVTASRLLRAFDLDARPLVMTVGTGGDSWRILAPPGTTIIDNELGRGYIIIPGVLAPLGAWAVIEAARLGLFGLRPFGYSPSGTTKYLACLYPDTPLPLFPEASDRGRP